MNHPKPSLKSYLQRSFAVPSFPPTWKIFQPLGGSVAFLAQSAGLTPNGITYLGGLLGILACYQFATLPITTMASIYLGVLFMVVYCFDCADGQLARATQQSSQMGKWLDLTVDLFLIILFPLCIAWFISPSYSKIQLSILILTLVFGRASALLTSALKRSGGEDHTPNLSTIIKVFQSLIDTPVFYTVLCGTRLDLSLIYFFSIGYGIYFFSVSVYFTRTFRT